LKFLFPPSTPLALDWQGLVNGWNPKARLDFPPPPDSGGFSPSYTVQTAFVFSVSPKIKNGVPFLQKFLGFKPPVISDPACSIGSVGSWIFHFPWVFPKKRNMSTILLFPPHLFPCVFLFSAAFCFFLQVRSSNKSLSPLPFFFPIRLFVLLCRSSEFLIIGPSFSYPWPLDLPVRFTANPLALCPLASSFFSPCAPLTPVFTLGIRGRVFPSRPFLFFFIPSLGASPHPAFSRYVDFTAFFPVSPPF